MVSAPDPLLLQGRIKAHLQIRGRQPRPGHRPPLHARGTVRDSARVSSNLNWVRPTLFQNTPL